MQASCLSAFYSVRLYRIRRKDWIFPLGQGRGVTNTWAEAPTARAVAMGWKRIITDYTSEKECQSWTGDLQDLSLKERRIINRREHLSRRAKTIYTILSSRLSRHS
jgi:hypothetical protein